MKRVLGTACGLAFILQAGVSGAGTLDWGQGNKKPVSRPAAVRPPPPAGTFGLGVAIGSDSGLAGKYRLGRSSSIDGGVAWADDLRIHSDFLYEGGPVLSRPKLMLGWYAGAGGLVRVSSPSGSATSGIALAATAAPKGGPPPGAGGGGAAASGGTTATATTMSLAARVPLGLELRFRKLPRLETFGEAALQVGVIGGPNAALGGIVGARWFF